MAQIIQTEYGQGHIHSDEGLRLGQEKPDSVAQASPEMRKNLLDELRKAQAAAPASGILQPLGALELAGIRVRKETEAEKKKEEEEEEEFLLSKTKVGAKDNCGL